MHFLTITATQAWAHQALVSFVMVSEQALLLVKNISSAIVAPIAMNEAPFGAFFVRNYLYFSNYFYAYGRAQ